MGEAQKTFIGVLNNRDDQVIVRELLERYVPPEVKLVIVDRFNAEMIRRNREE